jgi:hypothetical protein
VTALETFRGAVTDPTLGGAQMVRDTASLFRAAGTGSIEPLTTEPIGGARGATRFVVGGSAAAVAVGLAAEHVVVPVANAALDSAVNNGLITSETAGTVRAAGDEVNHVLADAAPVASFVSSTAQSWGAPSWLANGAGIVADVGVSAIPIVGQVYNGARLLNVARGAWSRWGS